MSNSVSSFEPTAECRDYIKNALLNGLTLSHKLAHQVDLSHGRICVCPKLESLSEARFSFGGVGSWGIARAELVAKVEEFLKARNRAAVFEHSLARAGDPAIKGKETQFAFFDSEVYNPVESFADRDTICSAIKSTVSANRLFCALCDLPESQAFPTARAILAARRLDLLIDSLQAIVVGAFDGEGWLRWDRLNPLRPLS